MQKILLLILLWVFSIEAYAQCWRQASASKDGSNPGSHTLVIATDGSLWSFGNNSSGQLGDGSALSNLVSLTQVDTGPWTSVSSGVHSIGIQQDGSLWGWGANDAGQVGIGVNSPSVNSPVLIDNSNDWKMVSTGNNTNSSAEFSLAIRDDNALWAWGGGQSTYVTGNGTPSNLPTQVGTATQIFYMIYADNYKSNGE